MLAFTYGCFSDTIKKIKISQGCRDEKSDFNDDIWFTGRDYL